MQHRAIVVLRHMKKAHELQLAGAEKQGRTNQAEELRQKVKEVDEGLRILENAIGQPSREPGSPPERVAKKAPRRTARKRPACRTRSEGKKKR
jgi:hypothetical protein